MFLKEDAERVKALYQEQERFMSLAKVALSKHDYRTAEDYLHHVIKLIAEIRKLKELKEMYNEAHGLLKQAKLSGLTDQMIMNRKNYF